MAQVSVEEEAAFVDGSASPMQGVFHGSYGEQQDATGPECAKDVIEQHRCLCLAEIVKRKVGIDAVE